MSQSWQGSFSGYSSARIYKLLGGKNWKTCTLMTGTLYPGVMGFIFLCINTVVALEGSSTAAPFTALLAVLALLVCISLPLVFIGSYFGFRRETISTPVRTNQIARHIPDEVSTHIYNMHIYINKCKYINICIYTCIYMYVDMKPSPLSSSYSTSYCIHTLCFVNTLFSTTMIIMIIIMIMMMQMWYSNPLFGIALGGILPFGAVCIEMYYLMSAMWLHQLYGNHYLKHMHSHLILSCCIYIRYICYIYVTTYMNPSLWNLHYSRIHFNHNHM